MLAFQSGKDVAITVDFTVDGEFVVPEVARYTIRGVAGNILSGYQDVNITIAGTSVILNIPAALNTKASGSIENRFVEIDFQYGGIWHQHQVVYQLIDFVPMMVTAEDVRNHIGLDWDELPDRMINLYGAYLTTKADFIKDIDNLLVQSDRNMILANEVISLTAAIDILGALQLRVMKSTKSEDATFIRFDSIDWQSLRQDLEARRNGILSTLNQGGSTLEEVSIFSVVSPTTDALTG